jgi:hypothetical protein
LSTTTGYLLSVDHFEITAGGKFCRARSCQYAVLGFADGFGNVNRIFKSLQCRYRAKPAGPIRNCRIVLDLSILSRVCPGPRVETAIILEHTDAQADGVDKTCFLSASVITRVGRLFGTVAVFFTRPGTPVC